MEGILSLSITYTTINTLKVFELYIISNEEMFLKTQSVLNISKSPLTDKIKDLRSPLTGISVQTLLRI